MAKPAVVKTDWTKVKFEFVHSGVTVAELARKYKLKEDTIWKRVSREGWADLRVEAEQSAFAEAAAKVAKDRVKDLLSFNQDDLKIARALRARVAMRLSEKTTDGKDKAIASLELRQLATTAEVAQKMGRLALGASTDNLGVGGPGGEGPVPIINVSKEELAQATKEALENY